LRGKYLEPPVFDKIVKIHRFCADSFQCTLIVELNPFNTISDNWIPLSMLMWHYRFTYSCQIYKKRPCTAPLHSIILIFLFSFFLHLPQIRTLPPCRAPPPPGSLHRPPSPLCSMLRAPPTPTPRAANPYFARRRQAPLPPGSLHRVSSPPCSLLRAPLTPAPRAAAALLRICATAGLVHVCAVVGLPGPRRRRSAPAPVLRRRPRPAVVPAPMNLVE
jgi:hypothetical protein